MEDKKENKKPVKNKAPKNKTDKKKQNKKNVDSNTEVLIEKITEQQMDTLNTDLKITKDNVFEILDTESTKKNVIVPKKVVKILNKINKNKRKTDERAGLKNEGNKIIEVKNVSKYYVNDNVVSKVLKNVSMDVRKGEFLLIFGISGCGKSTLLNIISGLDRPTKGDVIVCDKNLPYLSNSQLVDFRRKYVSFIFQNYNLLAGLSAYDNVETGGYLQKSPDRKVDIIELFKLFELEEEMQKFPSQMSGGQQQRVSIMRALAKNSEIIFADEPTGALDESTTRIVLRMLYDIHKEKGTTVVMVSHNPTMSVMADRVVHMVDGKVGKIEVNENPIHPDKIELFK